MYVSMLNIFVCRIVGRLGDPLVGVHDWLLVGNDLVVPGCAGLGDAVQICPIPCSIHLLDKC